jgi:hypothetical protein
MRTHVSSCSTSFLTCPDPATHSPERDADSIFEEWRGGRISSARRHLDVFVGGDRNA